MGRESRRVRDNKKLVEAERKYEITEALSLLKQAKSAKFDETVEVAIRLGIDPKKSDQMVRGVAKLPHGTGRNVRVLVFAKGDKAQEALAAGADFVGAEDLVEKIKEGWLDFDKAIATPDMMGKVGPIAKILGPRGLMPNPKVGTVTADVAKAVQEEKAGRVEFRVEKAGIVHVPVGKLSFQVSQLAENLGALLEQVVRMKPPTAKGNYLLSIGVTSTMGPAFKLDPARVQSAADRE